MNLCAQSVLLASVQCRKVILSSLNYRLDSDNFYEQANKHKAEVNMLFQGALECQAVGVVGVGGRVGITPFSKRKEASETHLQIPKSWLVEVKVSLSWISWN